MVFFITFLCIIFLLVSIFGHFYYYQKPQNIHNLTISPANTIISFDIHGVLFEPDTKKIKQLLKKNPKVFLVLRYLFWPPLLFDLIRLLKKKAVPEEIISHLTTQYTGLAQYKNLAIKLANAQKPIPGMLKLIKQLHVNGYQLHIFSNIGIQIYQELAHEYQEIFSFFHRVHMPNTTNNFIGKPHIGAFQDYINRCNPHKMQVLFIDNRWRNVTSAHRVGIFGIHFKSAHHLHKKFGHLLRSINA